jgi:beta-glucanase (GH16 family)
MIKYILSFLCLICLVFQTKSQVNANRKMIWSDEFNCAESFPDTAKWNYDKGDGCPALCGWGNNEQQYYTVSRLKNARIENGMLVLEVHKEDFQNGKYTSARLTSKNKGDWKYGRMEIKARIPKGRGIWPAIWMMPTQNAYGTWPHSGEIDIMENVGYWPDSLFATVHTGYYNGMNGTQKSKAIHHNTLSKEFHVYAVEWSEERIDFFVDDMKFQSFSNDHTNTEAWPFDKEFHLLMNGAVGGHWGGKYGIDDTIFPQRMEVDYVRVYQ